MQMEPVGRGRGKQWPAPCPNRAVNELNIDGVMPELAVPAPCDDLNFVFLFPDMLSEEFSAEKRELLRPCVEYCIQPGHL